MSFASCGKGTYQVPMKLHFENRRRLFEKLHNSPQAHLLKQSEGAVLLQGGTSEHVARYDTDGENIFRQESYFQWAFGAKEPDLFGSILLPKFHSILFVTRVPESYVPFVGEGMSLEEYRTHYEVDEVHYVDQMKQVLAEHHKIKTLYLIKGLNTDSGKESVPAHFDGIADFQLDFNILHRHISELRVFKTPYELDLLRHLNKLSSDAHIEVMKTIQPGRPEWQSEATFKYFAQSKGGCRHLAYTPICCSGHNGAILHYGHAALPNTKTVEDGEMILNDMGADYHCYCADITCSFPVNGKFTPDQRLIYEAVLDAQTAVNAASKPGVSWVEMHHLAYVKILTALKAGGLVQGDVEEMIKAEVGGVFMPHGLGHFLGLDTHDAGGYPVECSHPRIDRPGFRSLRTARILEEGMVITNEPGVYFIKPLLEKAFNNPAQAKFLVKERIEQFKNFGGVRLEDNIIITKDGIENMTKVPRTVADVEKTMAH